MSVETVLQLSAPIGGLVLGTLLFARVGSWVQAIVAALKAPGSGRRALPLVALLHSGPWLLAAVAYWAYHVLSQHRTIQRIHGPLAARRSRRRQGRGFSSARHAGRSRRWPTAGPETQVTPDP